MGSVQGAVAGVEWFAGVAGTVVLQGDAAGIGAVELLAAAAPLIVVAVLLVGLLWPATRVMPIAWLVALVVGFVVWGNDPTWLAAASINGAITAITILYIVFGALVLLYTLMQAGALDRINRGFAAVSEDRRVQIVMLAFFMATFIEGAAGFGTPAAVVAPLLLGLGFPALAAVIAALIGHVIAVTYGAVGTPIVIGIRNPMDSASYMGNEEIIAGTIYEGMDQLEAATEFANNVAAWAATFHALVGFVMPLFAVGMVVYFFGEERSLAPVRAVVPLCLFAGIAFAIPYVVSAWYISAEFPALIGSMVGGGLTLTLLSNGYLLPDDEWEFPDRDSWADHWVGDIEPGGEGLETEGTGDMSLLTAWSPYIFLAVLLVLTRAIDPVSEVITDASIGVDVGNFTLGIVLGWSDIFGTGLGGSIGWVNVPGFWLLLSAVVAVPIFGMSSRQVSNAWGEAVQKIAAPFVALTFVLMMVEVMLSAGSPAANPEQFVGDAEFAVSMIDALAIETADIVGDAYPLIASLIGGLGAAMAGSNTVSNITFGPFQFTAAGQLEISRTIIVGAQAVGGAIGNLVAIHNVVAALATVGLVGQEGRVMRLNLIPLVYYAAMVGILALLFVFVLFTGTF
ncbi:lactate permease [Halobacteriales archaeon QH_10_65_19]|jgi:lactate permease|nr:MAG: lactate permease [Halobacteriales archaeon QH_10_65_19]